MVWWNKALAAGAVFIFLQGIAAEMPAEGATYEGDKNAEIAIFIPGNEHDNGFMEAAYRGYEKIRADVTPSVRYVSNVSAKSEQTDLTKELEIMAAASPKLIIAHGGQCDKPVETVSAKYPGILFVVIQGHVKSQNVSSYRVNQEQSAWLAGALAGYMTKTGKVGHISGAWPRPGLRARAAFYDGLHYANPNAAFYSVFTGNLDDKIVNQQAAEAELKKGVDVIYTMLNGGRAGVTEAIQASEGKASEIGNVIDWTKESPVFIGSAVADSSVAIYQAARDYQSGTLAGGQEQEIGLEDSAVVRLAVSEKVPVQITEKLDELKAKIQNGEITVNTTYNGFEFDPQTGVLVSQDKKNNKNNRKS